MTPAGLRRLQLDEGCRLVAYQDAGGVWTIGYGHTGPEVHQGLTWTQAQADAQFAADVAAKEHEMAARMPWLDRLDAVRNDVLTNIAFNVGVVGLLHWPVTIGHFAAKEFAKASNDLLHEGKWNRDVGPRADRLAAATLSGSWAA